MKFLVVLIILSIYKIPHSVAQSEEQEACDLPTTDLLPAYVKKSIVDIVKEIDLSRDYSKKVKRCYRPNTTLSSDFKLSKELIESGGFKSSDDFDDYPVSFWQVEEEDDDLSKKVKEYFKEKKDLDVEIGHSQEMRSFLNESAEAKKIESEIQDKFSSQINELSKKMNMVEENLIGSDVSKDTLHKILNDNLELKKQIKKETANKLATIDINENSKEKLANHFAHMAIGDKDLHSTLWKKKYHDKALRERAKKFDPSKLKAVELRKTSTAGKNSFKDVKQSLAEGNNYSNVLSKIEGWANKNIFIPKKAGRIAAKIRQTTFNDTNLSYSGGNVSVQNQGVINYISNDLIPSNPKLIESTSKLLDEVNKLPMADKQIHLEPIKDGPDLYSMALKSADGDPIAALETISIFGHDDCCNPLMPGKDVPNDIANSQMLLNVKKENSRTFYMYSSGAIKGLDIDPTLRKKFKEIRDNMESISKANSGKKYAGFYERSFRSAYYHFYGGIFSATQLIKDGLNKVGPMGIADFIAEKMAGAYKRMNIDDYMKNDSSSDVQDLFEKGYRPGGKIQKPEGWEEKQFEMAKLKIDLNFLHIELAEQQHRKGAEFAAMKIKEWAKNKGCKEMDLSKK